MWLPYLIIQLDCSQDGYKGFYARNTVTLTPKSVNDIHKRGGTILGTSRGGHDTSKIADSIEDRGINQVKKTISGVILAVSSSFCQFPFLIS